MTTSAGEDGGRSDLAYEDLAVLSRLQRGLWVARVPGTAPLAQTLVSCGLILGDEQRTTTWLAKGVPQGVVYSNGGGRPTRVTVGTGGCCAPFVVGIRCACRGYWALLPGKMVRKCQLQNARAMARLATSHLADAPVMTDSGKSITQGGLKQQVRV